MEINKAGTLNVSKKISAAFSRFLLGFSGASVNNTGCCTKQEETTVIYTSIVKMFLHI